MARAESETPFREVFDQAGIGMAVADLSGHILRCNRALCRMLGYTEEELTGIAAERLVHEDDLEPVLSLIRDVLEGRRDRLRFEPRFVRKDKSLFWGRATISLVRGEHDRPDCAVALLEDVTERRRAEDSLRESERRLSLLTMQVPAVLWATDKSLRLTSSTGSGLKRLGIEPGAAVGSTLQEIWETDDPTLPPIAAHLRALAGERVTYEYEWGGRAFRSLVEPMHDEEGRVIGVVGIAVDVTEQAQTADALRESEVNFRQLAASLREVLWLGDVATGRILYVSPGYRELWGRPEEELYRDPEARIAAIHPDDRARVRHALAEGLREGAYETEYRVVRPDGAERHVRDRGFTIHDARGRAYRVAGLAEDVTRKHEADEALRHAEEVRRSITESSPDHIMLLDLDARILFINRTVSDLTIEQVLGRPVFDFIPPRFHPAVHACFDHVAATGGEGAYEVEYPMADGRVLWFVSRVWPIRRDDNVTAFAVCATDVTAKRLLERQLQHAQKMESIGRLAGGIAHDLNNQLSVIMGSAELARRALDARSTVEAELGRIQAAGERSAALTRQLLAFGRKQVLKPRVLGLNTLVAGVQEMLRRVIGEDIRLRLELERVGQVRVDAGQIEQVILNLAINARDAMPDGGELLLATREVALPEGRACLPAGRYAELAVRDTGTGMDAATLARVFEPFFTTKEVGKGTGLGLAVAHGIVTQSGGHIEVESTPGAGTTFRIHLPVVEGNPEDETSAPPPAARGSETVLLVEDEPHVLDTMRRVLEERGYRVLEATDGVEALARLERAGADVRLLLTDVVMPGMDGRELAARALERRPDLRVLLVSGYAPDIVQGAHGAPHPFLQKPIVPEVLAHRVREVLDAPVSPSSRPAVPRAALRPRA
jgi:PAS domain S-box-containing protein